MPRQHLRAETDAEIGLVLAQGHANPVDLAGHEIVGVGSAHRTAEIDRAGMVAQALGQGIAKARTTNVETMAARLQQAANATGSRMLLMQDNENGMLRAVLQVEFDHGRLRG